MKTTKLEVTQSGDEYDKSSLDSAVQLAQGKMQQLGLKDFDNVALSFTIGATNVAISLYSSPDAEQAETPEE